MPTGEPKYYRVKQELLANITAARPGEPVPPERDLANQFHTSRTTVRQALAELVVEGRLERSQGRGTFVAEPKMTQPLRLISDTEEARAAGHRPTSRLIDITTIAADAELADRLALPSSAPVLRITRLRLADDTPMALETTHLDESRFANLGRYLHNGASLYATLEEIYGARLGKAEEAIETVLCSPPDATILHTDPGAPMLLLSRHSLDTTGKPVEYVRSLYRGDRYKFVTTLHLA